MHDSSSDLCVCVCVCVYVCVCVCVCVCDDDDDVCSLISGWPLIGFFLRGHRYK